MVLCFRILGSAAVLGLFVAACATSTVSTQTDAGSEAEDGGASSGDGGGDASTSKDSGAGSPWCDALAAKQERCDGTRECGTAFTSWCAERSKTNSKSFEAADSVCLANGCDSKTRSDCRYRTYKPADLTPIQKSFITAYCNTCASAGCEASFLTYDPVKGPSAVSDAYVAAWELSDTITDKIRTKCTGAGLALDGGADCVKAFGSCAADVYLNELQDCP